MNFIGKYAVVKIVSRSMEPTIEAGDYILVEKADPGDLEEGEIVTFYSDDPAISGRLNTHRISRFAENGNIVTKGDNNPAEDKYEVPPEKVAGRYVRTLGFLTSLFNIFSQPVGYAALIGVPLLLITMFGVKDFSAALKKDGAEKGDTEDTHEKIKATLEKMKASGELDRLLAERKRDEGTPGENGTKPNPGKKRDEGLAEDERKDTE